MSDFIFSVNVTFPIFLVMVIGWVLHQIGMLDEHFVTVANRFNFKVTLPFMLFRDIASVEISKVFDLKFVLYCAIVSSICFWGIWGISKFAVKDDSIRGAFVQSSFRSSAAVMGMAFINNIYGSSAMGPLMIVGAVPLYNVYSVIVLTFEAQDEEGKRDKGKIKQALVNIVKNPIIDSIFLGLIVSLLGIHFPTIVNKTINSVNDQTYVLGSCNQTGDPATGLFTGSSLYGIFRGKDYCNFNYAGIPDNAKLLHHGKEYEK